MLLGVTMLVVTSCVVDDLSLINDAGGLKEASDSKTNVKFYGDLGRITLFTHHKSASPAQLCILRAIVPDPDPSSETRQRKRFLTYTLVR